MKIVNHGWVYEIDVTSFSEGEQAYTSGLPEDCHPGSSPEVEFDVHSITPEADENPLYTDILSYEDLEEIIIENYGE